MKMLNYNEIISGVGYSKMNKSKVKETFQEYKSKRKDSKATTRQKENV